MTRNVTSKYNAKSLGLKYSINFPFKYALPVMCECFCLKYKHMMTIL